MAEMAHNVCPGWTTWITAPSGPGVEARMGENATTVAEAALATPGPLEADVVALPVELFPGEPLPDIAPTSRV